MVNSRLKGFYNLSLDERIKVIAEQVDLTDEDIQLLKGKNIDLDVYDHMIENVIGIMPFPMGIATNFKINGKDYLVPMVIEEPSVVAAASHAAKIARKKGGFEAHNTGSFMIGQIQVVGLNNPHAARFEVLKHSKEIIELANKQDPILVKLGGGATDVRARIIYTIMGDMLIVELIVNCLDAMGANAVNTMAEKVAPFIEKITGGKVYLRILSNLADMRLVRARAVFDKEELGGEDVVEGILNAYAFADADPYRCATHNKGIMNGISAVVRATGNDTRAIEAGAHSYAARSGYYSSLTTYEKNSDGDLVGTIEVPMAVGIIGGATKAHPLARLALKILGVKSAGELANVIASVGLAQNLAALRALAAEGIQKGHMALHARNIAMAVGAKGDLIEKIADEMIAENKINYDFAKELLSKYKK